MIQIISYFKKKQDARNIVFSSFQEPKSLDEFDITIIDLTNKDIWYNNGSDFKTINGIKDFENLYKMLYYKKLTKVIILLPQDMNFNYNYTFIANKGYTFNKSIELKNMIENMINIIKGLIGAEFYRLVYENTTTVLNSIDYSASFYFEDTSNEVLTKSKSSNKSTTILLNDIILTTLNIGIEPEKLYNFLKYIHLIEINENAPAWFNNIDMFDDIELKRNIFENEIFIKDYLNKIDEYMAKLKQNNEYKSILYTNGDELVAVIFKILELLLNHNLSEFTDEKNEDFLIIKENITFIGEIKGVTSNVKSEHISQLDVHYNGYLDKLFDENNTQNEVKSVLIINHQRNLPLNQRQPVHENQIKLAERNNSLIIETYTLLQLYEKFVNNEITSDKCISLIIKNKGLLKLEES